MGCSNSSEGITGDERISQRLMEEFEVGDMLGEGAFGVVYSCKNRRTNEEVAVKMVDKVETPIEEIKKEAEMLKGLSHYNIVKFHRVYFEKCFVCIVMDKYGGGDLIDGLHLHLKEKGKINCYSVVHVSAQMASSLHYLHKRLIIHRDVKGDNYLMDMKDIANPSCRIVLTDFGTASNMTETERCSAEVGTKIFWAPEVFNRDYGMKADIWAMGVTMYGLLDGHFPFKDEHDIKKKTKQIRFPRVDSSCEDYLRGMLLRDEAARFSAEQVMAHKWIKGSNTGADGQLPGHVVVTELDDSTPMGESNMRDDVNAGVQDRRRELVDRLNQAEGEKGNEKKADAQHFWARWFTVADQRTGGTLKFEWWDEVRVRKSGILSMEGMRQNMDDASGDMDRSPQVVGQMLKEHNVDINAFGVGDAKTLEQLAAEVEGGSVRLMLDAANYKKIVRVVDIVLLRLYADSRCTKMLVETAEKYPNGHRRDTMRMPAAKKQPHETTKEVAQRVLKDFLNMGDCDVHFSFDKKESYEEETESPSYPGVTTVYRKEICQCYVKDTNTELLNAIGLPKCEPWSAEESNHQIRFLAWMTEEQATAKNVKLRAGGSEEVSGLVMAPIGFAEDDLATILTNNKVDVSEYGQGVAKSLKAFSAELIKGESSLMQSGDGGLVRVVDTVFLKLVNPQATEMLSQVEQTFADGRKSNVEILPNATRRPDENQFLTVKRILRRHLKIEENKVKLNNKSVRYFQEEKILPEYPGIKTVYRKRVISARLQKKA